MAAFLAHRDKEESERNADFFAEGGASGRLARREKHIRLRRLARPSGADEPE